LEANKSDPYSIQGFEKREFTISLQQGPRNTQAQTGRLEPRTLLNQRYVIMRTIGHGGMGAVYQARDLSRQTICAIKEMSLSMVPLEERAKAVQNFKAEAKMLANLHHPNLPTFSDFFTEGSRHFLVMEYVDGITLDSYLERNNGPFPERRVLGWARQLCAVLTYLHSQTPAIIFRDMKPGNIMLMQNGRVKLIDLGIARFFRHASSQDTQLLGTPGFAPPEQYGKAQTDERSDIYSLAMTLFQLMTNTLSEKGFGLQDVHLVNPQISLHVARALEKATALSPGDRFQSAEAFRQALFGEGTFLFESGDQATTPEELADLCAHFPREAADYLFAGEIETWLQEIGASDLARATKQIRTIESDPGEAIEQFLQVVMGPNVYIRGNMGKQPIKSSQTGKAVPPGAAGSRNSRTWLPSMHILTSGIIVQPLTIDFGEVQPGLSEPVELTIIGDRSTFIDGTISVTEPWILVDKTNFDAMTTRVNVQVNTSRLRDSTHYTGTILVIPNDDDEDQDIVVKVEVDVPAKVNGSRSSNSTVNGQSRPGQFQREDDKEEEKSTLTASGLVMAPGTSASRGLNKAKYNEYRTKYGAPPEERSSSSPRSWDPLQTTPLQDLWVQRGLTLFAAFMVASLCYTLLSRMPFIAHISLLPPNPLFILVLLLIVPAATLGALVVNWGRTSLSYQDIISRICTGLSTTLLVLGAVELVWQSFMRLNAPLLHLLVMLLVAAIGGTVGTQPAVSEQVMERVTLALEYVRGLVIAAAVALGGIVGFALTIGFPLTLLTPLGILVGCGIAMALVLWGDHLLKQIYP